MYVVDTNIWVTLGRDFPPDVFDTLWSTLDQMIEGETLRSPHVVLEELERGTDDLAVILKAKRGLFVPTDASLLLEVRNVLAVCPSLVDPNAPNDSADPYVVAL